MIEDMAKRLVSERYEDCSVAILAGSMVRGEGTDHADLDLFILNHLISGPYRESYEYEGRPAV
ncbi:MAG: hypothetical protein ACO1OC_08245 [Tuberibacillus sp.]